MLSKTTLGIVLSTLLFMGLVTPSFTQYATAETSVTIQAQTQSGQQLNMWTTLQYNGKTIQSGFTPKVFTADFSNGGYTVTVADYRDRIFSQWDDGTTSRVKQITNQEVLIAKYNVLWEKVLNVSSMANNDIITGMYSVIRQDGNVIQTGFTPFKFIGETGKSYTISVADYQERKFSKWSDGVTSRQRTLTLTNDISLTAEYSIANQVLPKTGVYVALYNYPSGTGWNNWQKVIDTKLKYQDVPIVVTINPNSGVGSSKDTNFVNGIKKLQDSGVVVLGYVPDGYADTKNPGSRTMSYMKDSITKYHNWYNVDGIFLDEMTNKPGYENRYKEITSFVKSLGMKLTMGNPGTEVPQSYIGTVDVINIREQRGYPSLNTLQYCAGCNEINGWHYKYDKRNFSYMAYGVSTLDTSYELQSSKWVGLLYITSGDDSNGRWFVLPSYFDTMVKTLSQR